MKNVLLKISYDGTNYHGYQIQPRESTVEGELNIAIEKTTGEKVKLYSAGRTDTGVHAIGQYANFYTNTNIDIGNLPKVINYNLPGDISILDAKYVKDDFHARFSANKKKYRYVIYNSKNRNAILENRAYQYPYPLNELRMREALKYLVGTHDFKSFMGKGAIVKDSLRTIYEIDIKRDGKLIYVDFLGKAFLKNMIRIIIGTTIEIGRGKKDIDFMQEALISKKRIASGPTAPSCGLYLVNIYY